MEIQEIKEKLSKDSVNIDIKDIERAILLPAAAGENVPVIKPLEGEPLPFTRYPDVAESLLKNPFAKKKKKKKGKKKKRK